MVGRQPKTGTVDTRLLFVRKRSPLLTTARRTVAVLNDALTRLRNPLFTFDEHIDLIVAPGRGVIGLSERPFNLLFRDAPELVERTPTLAGSIADALPLHTGGREILIDAAQRYARVRARILSLAAKPYVQSLTVNTIRAELVRQGIDPAEFIRGRAIVLADTNVQDFVRVLNEDLLTGGFSATRFDVGRKRPLGS